MQYKCDIYSFAMTVTCFIYTLSVLLVMCGAQPYQLAQEYVRTLPTEPTNLKLTPIPRTVAGAIKSPNCFQEIFETLDECCEDAPYDLFTKESRHSCYKNWNWGYISQSLETSRQYVINKWQTAYNYTLDLSSMIQYERRERSECFMDCLFKAQGLLSADMKLKVDAIAEYFKKTGLNSMVMEAVTKCSVSVPALLPSLKIVDKCNPHAFLYIQCLWKEILLLKPVLHAVLHSNIAKIINK